MVALAPGDGLLLAGIGAISGRGSHDSFVLISSAPGTGRAGAFNFEGSDLPRGARSVRGGWAAIRKGSCISAIEAGLSSGAEAEGRPMWAHSVPPLRVRGPVRDGLEVSTRLRAASRR